jgi:CubicO group peptidase (beta-lactamase class C family)
MQALSEVERWPAENVAVAAVTPEGVLDQRGDASRVFRWASVTKPVTALAALVAAEEGTLDLDEPAGPPGSTLRHLLAHASGLPFEGTTPIASPGKRRIYSNAGFEEIGRVVEARAEMPFADFLQQAVLDPLRMKDVQQVGSPAAGLHGSLDDLVAFAKELLGPTLIAPETLAEATSVQFPGLAGVIPDLGRFDPNDWGLGFEVKGSKQPHFSGARTSPRTFGHWGGSGTFVWVDPERGLALATLTDLEFGDWAKEAWPPFSESVVAELQRGTPGSPVSPLLARGGRDAGASGAADWPWRSSVPYLVPEPPAGQSPAPAAGRRFSRGVLDRATYRSVAPRH